MKRVCFHSQIDVFYSDFQLRLQPPTWRGTEVEVQRILREHRSLPLPTPRRHNIIDFFYGSTTPVRLVPLKVPERVWLSPLSLDFTGIHKYVPTSSKILPVPGWRLQCYVDPCSRYQRTTVHSSISFRILDLSREHSSPTSFCGWKYFISRCYLIKLIRSTTKSGGTIFFIGVWFQSNR